MLAKNNIAWTNKLNNRHIFSTGSQTIMNKLRLMKGVYDPIVNSDNQGFSLQTRASSMEVSKTQQIDKNSTSLVELN